MTSIGNGITATAAARTAADRAWPPSQTKQHDADGHCGGEAVPVADRVAEPGGGRREELARARCRRRTRARSGSEAPARTTITESRAPRPRATSGRSLAATEITTSTNTPRYPSTRTTSTKVPPLSLAQPIEIAVQMAREARHTPAPSAKAGTRDRGQPPSAMAITTAHQIADGGPAGRARANTRRPQAQGRHKATATATAISGCSVAGRHVSRRDATPRRAASPDVAIVCAPWDEAGFDLGIAGVTWLGWSSWP